MSGSRYAPGMGNASSTMDWWLIVIVALVVVAAAFYFFGRGRVSSEARAGLMLGLRGLVGKDLRSRNRGWKPIALLTGYLGIMAFAVVGFLGLMGMVGGMISPTIGSQLFSMLGTGAVLLLAFITPALTVGAISGERERRTLDLLLVTGASPLGLAIGKLAGSLSYVLFLLAASLPFFALVYLFGGVPIIYIVMVLAVAIVTALAHASLGLLLSALLRKTIVASVVAYLLVLFLILGLPFGAAVAAVASQRADSNGMPAAGAPAVYVYASPMTSVSSVLPSGSAGSGIPLVGDLMRVFTTGGSYGYENPVQNNPDIAHAVYVVSVDKLTGEPQTIIKLAPWVYNFAFSGMLTIICLGATALLLAPVKPWRRPKRMKVMSDELWVMSRNEPG